MESGENHKVFIFDWIESVFSFLRTPFWVWLHVMLRRHRFDHSNVPLNWLCLATKAHWSVLRFVMGTLNRDEIPYRYCFVMCLVVANSTTKASTMNNVSNQSKKTTWIESKEQERNLFRVEAGFGMPECTHMTFPRWSHRVVLRS